MTFTHRLKLYGLGILIGSVCAWFIFGQRLLNAGWTPEERIRKRIEATLVKVSPLAQQQLSSWPADLSQVKAGVASADVIVGETRRRADSLFYTMDATVQNKPARLVFAVLEHYEVDSTAALMSVTAR